MAMQVGAGKDGEAVSDINTTPLIDVMLVLLIMFIVTLPPQRQATNIDTPIPCGDCDPESGLPDPVRIMIDFDGGYYWNGAQMTRAEIEQRLAVEARRAVQPEIHIEPHRLANYGHVAGIMAVAQREGLARLGVTTAG